MSTPLKEESQFLLNDPVETRPHHLNGYVNYPIHIHTKSLYNRYWLTISCIQPRLTRAGLPKLHIGSFNRYLTESTSNVRYDGLL